MPVRWGLIGCGRIAQWAHLGAVAQMPDRATLVAAADTNLEAARTAAGPWAAATYSDFRGLLARKDVDAVIIATPEFAHREQVLEAAAAGKHVLIEKPLAGSLEDADAMLEACRSAGITLMVGHSRRFTQRYIAVRTAVDEGRIGQVRLVRENERRTTRPQGYWQHGHWSADPAVSRGVATSNAIHEVDLLRWFIGCEACRVYAEARATVGAHAVPDAMSCVVEFADGSLGSTEIVPSLAPGHPHFHQLELYGTQGSIKALDPEILPLARTADGHMLHPGSREMLLENPVAYVREHAAFIATLRGERPLPMQPEEARAALQIALAADESARTGQPVTLAPAP